MATRIDKPVYRQRRRARQRGSEWQGNGFDSRFESTVAEGLTVLGVEYIHQPKPPIEYKKVSEYTPDFEIETRSGKKILIEAKGYLTSEDRAKHLLVVKQHPDKDIRFVFQKPLNRLNKNSNTTYASWCDRHKIKWAALTVPEEWIDE